MPQSHKKNPKYLHSYKIDNFKTCEKSNTQKQTSARNKHMPSTREQTAGAVASLPAAAQSVNCSPIVANNNSFQTVDWDGKRIKNKKQKPKKKRKRKNNNTHIYF